MSHARNGGPDETSEYVSPTFAERVYRIELKTEQLAEKMHSFTPVTAISKFESTMERLEESMRHAVERMDAVSKRVDDTQVKLNETVTEIAVIQTKLGVETEKLEKLEREVRDTGKFWSRWGVNLVVGALVAAITTLLLKR